MITPRNRKFDLSGALSEVWHGGDIFKTILVNSLSFPLPSGEKLFVESIRFFLDKIQDEKIYHDARMFIAQELIHSREHKIYNESLCRLRGYDLDMLESPYRSFMAFAKKNFEPKNLLAVTVCVEHLTTSLAEHSIFNHKWLDGAHPDIVDFWIWHAYEELEHRSVAFDVYQSIYGDKEQLNGIMKFVMRHLLKSILASACHMFAAEKGDPQDMKIWLKQSSFLMGDEGIIPPLMGSINRFFEADFTPQTSVNFAEVDKRYHEISLTFSKELSV